MEIIRDLDTHSLGYALCPGSLLFAVHLEVHIEAGGSLVDGISEPFFLKKRLSTSTCAARWCSSRCRPPRRCWSGSLWERCPAMTDGRAPVYFGRLPESLHPKRARFFIITIHPREFDDDEESSCSLSTLHIAASSTLWNISGCPLSTAAMCSSLRSLNPPGMLARSPPSGGDPLRSYRRPETATASYRLHPARPPRRSWGCHRGGEPTRPPVIHPGHTDGGEISVPGRVTVRFTLDQQDVSGLLCLLQPVQSVEGGQEPISHLNLSSPPGRSGIWWRPARRSGRRRVSTAGTSLPTSLT